MRALRPHLLVLLAAALSVGCEAPGPATPEAPATEASFDHVGSKDAVHLYFFGELPGAPSAVSRDGRSIEISLPDAGPAPFSLHPKEIAGGGDFTIYDAFGGVEYAGRWSATRLTSFVSYGSTEVAPGVVLSAGKLILQIELTGASGAVHKGLLELECTDFGTPPPGAPQGMTLDIPGVGKFTSTWPDLPNTDGFTFFILDV